MHSFDANHEDWIAPIVYIKFCLLFIKTMQHYVVAD